MKPPLTHYRLTILKTMLYLAVLIGLQSFCIAQNIQEFKGKVLDRDTNKTLPLADLQITGTNISTITNSEGDFLLKVPNEFMDKSVLVSYLGYNDQEILLIEFARSNHNIKLSEAPTVLAQVAINAPQDAEALVKKTLSLKGENYLDNATVMTSFYRETIKKRNKNASLSEAVLKIHKQPYSSNKKDAIVLIKARKNTNYSRLDTLTLKLQGGPFSTLHTDIVKYPEYIFNTEDIKDYVFSFNRPSQINDRLVYVVSFKPADQIIRPLYYGKLFIDAENYALVSAIYNLNVSNREAVSRRFVKKKPRKAKVYPTEAAYRVNYRVNDGKWFFGYSNILLTFKINWKNKLFNSKYTLQSEMAITDWNKNPNNFVNKPKGRLKPNTILADEASGFADPEFWGAYNIIEPEKSIESAINKISKQLKK